MHARLLISTPPYFFSFSYMIKSLFSVQIFDTFLIIFQAFISQKTTPGIEKFRMLFSAQTEYAANLR